MGNWFAGKPQGLGVENGRLSKCPDSPNCVCSQDDRKSHHIEPLKYEGDGDAAFARLAEILGSWPRTKIITQTDNYMHVEFTTPVLRFVDDGEFLLTKDHQEIQVRSASRVGYSDMGKNLERMNKLRAEFAESTGK